MRYFCSISVILLALSCTYNAELPSVYEVTFCSNYFEPLLSFEIAGILTENINPGDEIEINGVPGGWQPITAITQSGLMIEASAGLIGTDPSVRIILTENGTIKIE